MLQELWSNDIVWVSLLSSMVAQFLKPFTHWWRTRDFNWHHIADTGGMPSSHSALVSSMVVGIGIREGFGSGIFAVAAVVAMVVVYDAQGVRRQAGEHAKQINVIIATLLSGHPLSEDTLKEVLGHSRTEVAAGILFGIGTILLWINVIDPLIGG